MPISDSRTFRAMFVGSLLLTAGGVGWPQYLLDDLDTGIARKATVVPWVAATAGTENRNPPGVSVAILADKNKSGIPTINRDGKFQVVFTNQSKQPIRLWSEWCQPGYETLSFGIEESNGLHSLMYKRSPHPSNWKNKPSKTITISPGEAFSWDVNPSAIWGERVWKGVPEPNTGKLVTLTAIFEIKPTDAAKEHGVWAGRVTSEPIKALIVDPKLRTPHEYLWADCPKQALALIQADRTWIDKRQDHQQAPLHIAARCGFSDVVSWLLSNGANVNGKAYNEFTPLHMARDPEIIKLLLEHKADVNAKNASGRTALEEAASDYAHLERFPDAAGELEKWRIITKLLLDAGAEYDIRSACYLGDVERVRVLVADKQQARDKEAMRWAATYGRTKIVKLLLEHGADPEDAGYGGLTVSYFAIEHADVLKLLFDAGADPRVRVEYHGNGIGPQGSTLLHEAAGKGIIESAKLLLAHGIDVNLPTASGFTPLDAACRNGHVPMVEWLLRNMADARAPGKESWTPIALAASQVWPEKEEDNARYQAVIRTLERAGVELDVFAAVACNDIQRVANILQIDPKAGEVKDPAGRPAHHRAVTLDRKEIVALLLDKGSDPDIRSREEGVGHQDETALLDAAFWGRLEIAEMLIKHGANVNAKAAGGVTPLHEAARMRRVELVRLLLKHGADGIAKDTEGKTPLDWAGLDGESPEITKLLQDQGRIK